MKPRDPDNELKVEWSKKEQDFIVYYPSKQTGGFILNFLFGARYNTCTEPENYGHKKIEKTHWNQNVWWVELKSLRKELEERGYDISTLKFSIKKKRENKK